MYTLTLRVRFHVRLYQVELNGAPEKLSLGMPPSVGPQVIIKIQIQAYYMRRGDAQEAANF